MFEYLKKFLFAPNPENSELETYLSDKPIEDSVQLEFWMREYANRQRMINLEYNLGNYSRARWIKEHF